MEVIITTTARISRQFFILFVFSIFLTACAAKQAPLPISAMVPEHVTHEIEQLAASQQISYETRLWLGSMLINQCMMVEYYEKAPCNYPKINYDKNPREVR